MSPAPDNRRNFLAKLLAVAFGGIALAAPAFSALAAILNPWRQKTSQGMWVRVASLAALTLDKPQRCPVVADRTDAWNSFPAEPIGAVFLCRGANNEVLAFQSVCPHNGGGITFDAAKDCYYCPSHGAVFDVHGRRLDEKSISPRDLDSLAVEIRGGDVWVKFEKFRDGVSEKIVKS